MRVNRWRPLLSGGVLAAVAVAAAALVPAAASPGSHGHGRGRGHHLDHVFVIMLENHSRGDVIGDPDMPYTTSLAHEYGQATRYYGVTHPSEPNYIAATSGSTWSTNDDDGWNSGNHYPNPDVAGNHYPHTNIVDQLAAHHIGWAAYMDALPAAGYLPDDWPDKPGVDPLYQSKHDPFILYDDIRSNPRRRAHIKPYARMSRDLDSPHPPRYVWISPDLCHDLHGGVGEAVAGHPETPCPYGDAIHQDPAENSLQHKADAFVHGAVETITHSRAWTGRSVIVIVADENDFDPSNSSTGEWQTAEGCCDSPSLPPGDRYVSPSWPGGRYGGGLSPAIVISRHGPRHATDDTPYNHYSLLRTVEQGFGLPYLGYASDSAQVHAMWPLIDG